MARLVLNGLWRLSLTAALFSSAIFSFLTWRDATGAGFNREYLASSSAMDAARYALDCSNRIKDTNREVEVLLEALASTEPMGQRIMEGLARHTADDK